MSQATEPARNEEDRPFSRRTSGLIGLAAFAGAIAIALYVYYDTLSGFWPFALALIGLSVLQGLAALCLIDVMFTSVGMRSGGLWVMGRLLVMIAAVILGALGAWAYDNLIAVSALLWGVIDLALIDDER